MPPRYAIELLAFVVGLLFGSFLNVCISHLPHGQPIHEPRSRCARCRRTIHWYDNIPLLSFALLRARCRHCKMAIPWRYPLVELAVGLWFLLLSVPSAAAAAPAGSTPPYAIHILGLAALGFLLIGLMVMDWQTQRLPDAFTLTGIAIGFFLACAQAIFLAPGDGQILLPAEHLRLRSPGVGAVEGNVFMTGPEALVLGRVAAIALAALLLLFIRWTYRRLRGREGMGLGDIKLLAMIAAFLGLTPSLLALFAGILAASVAAAILLARGRATLATRLPFGSFLAGGGLMAALFGPAILAWYTTLFR